MALNMTARCDEIRNDEQPSPTDLVKLDIHTRSYLVNSNQIHYETTFNLKPIVFKNVFRDKGLSYLQQCFDEDPFLKMPDNFEIEIAYKLQEFYNLSYGFDTEEDDDFDRDEEEVEVNLRRRVFPLILELEIHEDEIDDDDDDDDDEFEEDLKMVPASKKFIENMKTCDFNVAKEREILRCVICMNEFDNVNINNEVTLCTLPCNHVFHQNCAVQWLQTSHTCPLCRYPMPTR
ncbi:uncharacterized protein [Cicer arietinum]|uniref:RING-type E3 ubiquitin transferase n=1 Tax=Cicer arietinum TaxID=3827 RepID=A0A1S2YC36_CICAR|nr:uncharacterized protein LOC101513936 [Cicer arietinum]